MASPSGTATVAPPSSPAAGGSIHWLSPAPAGPSPDVDAAWVMAMAARNARAHAAPMGTLCSRCALPRRAPAALPLCLRVGTQCSGSMGGTARPTLHAFLSDPDAFGCKRRAGEVQEPHAVATGGPWLPRALCTQGCACWRCGESDAAGRRWIEGSDGERSPSQSRPRSILRPEALADHHHSVAAAHAAAHPLHQSAGGQSARGAEGLASAREAHPSAPSPPGFGEYWDDGSGDAKIEPANKANSEKTELINECTLLEQRTNINNTEFEYQKEHLLEVESNVATESAQNFKKEENVSRSMEGGECEGSGEEEEQSSVVIHKVVHATDAVTGNMAGAVNDDDVPANTEKTDVEDSSNIVDGEVDVVDAATQCEAQCKEESPKKRNRSRAVTSAGWTDASHYSMKMTSSSSADDSSDSSESSGSSSSSDSTDASSATRSSTWAKRAVDLSECLWGYWAQNARSEQRRASDVEAVGAETASVATHGEATDDLSQSSSAPSVANPELLAPPSTPCETSQAGLGDGDSFRGFQAPNSSDARSIPVDFTSRSGIRDRTSLHISIPGVSAHQQASASPPPAAHDSAHASERAGRRAGARPIAKWTDRAAMVTTASSPNKAVSPRRLVPGVRVTGARRTAPPVATSIGFTVGQVNVAGAVLAGSGGGNPVGWHRGPARTVGRAT